MSLRPLVVKLGGAALSCTETLDKLFVSISQYQASAHRHLVIVHGGGYLVDDLMKALNLKVEKKQGLRVTPKDQVNVVAGALAGTANKLLQGEAIKCGINAVGLSLAWPSNYSPNSRSGIFLCNSTLLDVLFYIKDM